MLPAGLEGLLDKKWDEGKWSDVLDLVSSEDPAWAPVSGDALL
jgi:hypothetical protein